MNLCIYYLCGGGEGEIQMIHNYEFVHILFVWGRGGGNTNDT